MIQDLRFKNKYHEGQAMMVATVFFLALSLTIIFGLAGPIVRHEKAVSSLFNSRQSYFLAEAGIEDVVYRLDRGMSVGATETLSLGGESVTTVSTDTADGKLVVAQGEVKNLVRRVETDLVLGTGVAFYYGVQVGQGGFQLGNNAGVNGNIYSNASVSGSNGAFVSGSVVAVGSISNLLVGTGATGDAHAPSVTGSTVRGNLYCQSGSGNNKPCNTTLPNPTAQPFPITDQEIQAWKDEASAGGTVGSQTLSGLNNVLGPKKIQGNLTLGNSARLTLTGTLWVTGNIVLSNNAELVLSSGYGAADGVVVVDGTATLNNGSVLLGSGTTGSYIMILSTNNTASAIKVSNNTEAETILYAPYGTIEIENNSLIGQLTAWTIKLANNAVIDYDQGLVNSSFSNGPAGGYDIASWQEVE